MTRIKVTFYIDPEDLVPEFLDPGHESGLTAEGQVGLIHRYAPAEDVEFELVEE